MKREKNEKPLWECETNTDSANLKRHAGGSMLLYVVSHGIHEAYCVITKESERHLLELLKEREITPNQRAE